MQPTQNELAIHTRARAHTHTHTIVHFANFAKLTFMTHDKYQTLPFVIHAQLLIHTHTTTATATATECLYHGAYDQLWLPPPPPPPYTGSV